MVSKPMNKLITIVWTFLVYQLLAGFMFYQHGYEHTAFSLYFKYKSAVPLLLINIGMVVFICLLLLYSLYIKKISASKKRLPVLFFDAVENEFKNIFETMSLVAIVLIPWIGFSWMWVEFHDKRQEVWRNESPINEVGIYDIVSPITSFIGNWDDFQYGSIPEGISYVPFWQPIILMIPLTVIALFLTVHILIEIRK